MSDQTFILGFLGGLLCGFLLHFLIVPSKKLSAGDGTFTIPQGVSNVKIEMHAGGGGGGRMEVKSYTHKENQNGNN